MERVRLEFPATDLVHRHQLPVRIGDMNYGRHLAHDAVITLLHEARAHLFETLGFHEWDVLGHPSVVADLAIQYRAEAHWPDALVVDSAIPASQGRGFSVYQRLWRPADERAVALARVGVVLLDPAGGKPVELPPAFVEALAKAKQRGAD
jgi:acyl-CoA thioester hydrolase